MCRKLNNRKKIFVFFTASSFLAAVFFVFLISRLESHGLGAVAFSIQPPQINFVSPDMQSEKIVEEAGNFEESADLNWWLNSGGFFYARGDGGKTIQGSLLELEKWRQIYKIYNSDDTDGGTHPQNIFRLLRKGKIRSFRQEAYFKILKYNLSDSLNRKESNGVFLMGRYLDQNNLYYAGIRVDGYMVIKKKINGIYYTLAERPLLGDGKYNRDKNSNVLPLNKWIGMRMEIVDDGKFVRIKGMVDKNRSGDWILFVEALDRGQDENFPIKEEGFAGIRSDFMDMEFENYSILEKN